MVAPGKGILAADESSGTCQKRFDKIGIECTEENRRLYREMLFTTPEIENYLGGVILYRETFLQKTSDGVLFPQYLQSRNILPGIKVDKGVQDLPSFTGEKFTTGLDNLKQELAEYAALGAKFAKWRAVISIDPQNGIPSETCVRANAQGLALYASLCQEAGIVPIVEPEVLMDGVHTIEECETVTNNVLKTVFEELKNYKVALKGMILKPSMVIAGSGCTRSVSTEQIASLTVKTLKQWVPAEVPGIAFLSGGQSPIQSTENLNEMNKNNKDLPWKLSFSYGRALQEPALALFAQDIKNNIPHAQQQLLHRAKMNSLASLGQYSAEMEK